MYKEENNSDQKHVFIVPPFINQLYQIVSDHYIIKSVIQNQTNFDSVQIWQVNMNMTNHTQAQNSSTHASAINSQKDNIHKQ